MLLHELPLSHTVALDVWNQIFHFGVIFLDCGDGLRKIIIDLAHCRVARVTVVRKWNRWQLAVDRRRWRRQQILAMELSAISNSWRRIRQI